MNRSIYILLRGGLGNQLHQIAAAVKLSEILSSEVVIFAHIVDTAHNPERHGYFREINLEGLFPDAKFRRINYIENFILKILNLFNFKGFSFLITSEANFFSIKSRKKVILRGWFQELCYLPEKVDFKVLALKELNDDLVIHVRLTDFLLIDSNPLGAEYYKNALKNFSKTPEIVCYSDDISGAMNILPANENYRFPEKEVKLLAHELLSHLAASRNIICSKSSLCWWAAHAVDANGGKVYSPWGKGTHKDSWVRGSVF